NQWPAQKQSLSGTARAAQSFPPSPLGCRSGPSKSAKSVPAQPASIPAPFRDCPPNLLKCNLDENWLTSWKENLWAGKRADGNSSNVRGSQRLVEGFSSEGASHGPSAHNRE